VPDEWNKEKVKCHLFCFIKILHFFNSSTILGKAELKRGRLEGLQALAKGRKLLSKEVQRTTVL
jgi:hypothetical protein